MNHLSKKMGQLLIFKKLTPEEEKMLVQQFDSKKILDFYNDMLAISEEYAKTGDFSHKKVHKYKNAERLILLYSRSHMAKSPEQIQLLKKVAYAAQVCTLCNFYMQVKDKPWWAQRTKLEGDEYIRMMEEELSAFFDGVTKEQKEKWGEAFLSAKKQQKRLNERLKKLQDTKEKEKKLLRILKKQYIKFLELNNWFINLKNEIKECEDIENQLLQKNSSIEYEMKSIQKSIKVLEDKIENGIPESREELEGWKTELDGLSNRLISIGSRFEGNKEQIDRISQKHKHALKQMGIVCGELKMNIPRECLEGYGPDANYFETQYDPIQMALDYKKVLDKHISDAEDEMEIRETEKEIRRNMETVWLYSQNYETLMNEIEEQIRKDIFLEFEVLVKSRDDEPEPPIYAKPDVLYRQV